MFSIILLFPLFAQASIVLVNNGRTAYQIVLNDQAGKEEQKAALVLQDYLKRITDCELAIISSAQYTGDKAIFIGANQRSGFGASVLNDGFVIESQGVDLLIYGKQDKGTLYGVYHFLERYLHCKKLDGGEPASVPKMATVQIPSDLKDIQNPSFLFRQSYYPASLDTEYLDWHKLHNFETSWGLWGHSFFKIINPDEHFTSHPEYFALVGGVRQRTQLCLSNKDVISQTIAYFSAAISEKPEALYWSLSPMDNLGYCQCTDCQRTDRKEGGPQGSVIHFINRVAKQFPESRFVMLAYAYTSKPPKKIKPAVNVFIMLSTIEAMRTLPLENEPSARSFRDHLKDWNKVTKNLFIWDYTTQFTNYLTPFPIEKHLAKNTAYFKENHVKGVFFQGSESHLSDMAALNSYVQAKLLWNNDMSFEEIEQEFFSHYYGKAKAIMLQYRNSLAEAVRSTRSTLDIYGNPVNNRKDYLSPILLNKYVKALKDARRLTTADSIAFRHVNEVALSLEYVLLQQSLAYGTRRYGYLRLDSTQGVYRVKPAWKKKVSDFIKDARALGVTQLAEFGNSLDDYQQSWNKIVEQGWKSNAAQLASLKLLHPFAPEYPANGISTLTDGVLGQLDFSINWLLFYGKNLDLKLDFKKEHHVTSMEISFLHDPKHYILLPREVIILAAEDGTHFKEIARQMLPTVDDEGPRRETISLQLDHVAPAYQVIAVNQKQLPPGTAPAFKKISIAVDEVIFK